MVNIFWPFDFTDKRSLCWHGWIVEIFNVLVKNKIRTRLLPPSPLPNIVRIAMHIDIYGRSLKLKINKKIIHCKYKSNQILILLFKVSVSNEKR